MTLWSVLGSLLLALFLAGGLYVVAYRARVERILLPVFVGLGARLAVIAVTHAVSLATGHGGFLYLDDVGYAAAGRELAHQWSHLAFSNPLNPSVIAGTSGPQSGPAFYQLVGAVFLLTANSVLAVKLVDALLGTATVLLSAILARRTIGARAARPAAWGVALAPTIIWWTAPMLRESLAASLAVAALLAGTYLPARRGIVWTSILLFGLAFTRSTLFLAVALAILAWVGIRAVASGRPRAGPVVALAVIALVSGGLTLDLSKGSTTKVGAGVGIEFGRYERIYGTGGTGASANSGGPFKSEVFAGFSRVDIAAYPIAAVRYFVSPRAWAFVDQPFDWYQPLYPAMWLWYVLFPTALAGLWRLRRRLSVLLLALPPLLTAAAYSASLSSGVRQRSGVEPLLVLLIVAGLGSTWALLLSAGAVLLALAPVVSVDLGEPLAGVPVAAAGVALLVTGWRRRNGQQAPRGNPARFVDERACLRDSSGPTRGAQTGNHRPPGTERPGVARS